jgi:membrane-associated protease RseP (regulator of RpoE activity)
MNIAQMAGLAFILFVFVALTWNDLLRWWEELW